MKKSILFVAMIISYSVTAAPLPEPLERLNNTCPSGYSANNRYCSPNKNARFTLVKIGNSCPSGYSSSGRNYCLASTNNSRAAIAKKGTSCPRGYSSSGSNYCLANK
ncbi:MAG: hypothetical protein U1E09_15230 [Methylococcales bacterium]|nr:hypothetical protein [Methylobacter sp.]MDZ4157904.1 hypothetical protein [Methylococcales bacterium]MDP2097861.1 hypothetical protein [Methylobacter sp.]MDP2426565.1 hypothetical protein [Methylobacter sp.]MDP3056730.1 hypothetical protein [Methylobacter sp.]